MGYVKEPEGIDFFVKSTPLNDEDRKKIFQRFYRTKEAREDGVRGTGLGLAIVKHIAQSHEGRITVQSTPGHGSTFSFHLPRPHR